MRTDRNLGPVFLELLDQALDELFTVSFLVHIDKVDNDNTTHVPKLELSRYFAGRFNVGIEIVFFLVIRSDVACRVHIDKGSRLGIIYHQSSPPTHPHSAVGSFFNLLLHFKSVEYWAPFPVVFNPLPQFG